LGAQYRTDLSPDAGTEALHLHIADVASELLFRLYRDHYGKILIPTDGGLAVGSVAGFRIIGDSDGLRTMTSVVMEDREGSLLVGLVGEG
jgi:hypothetical protein